MKLNCADLRKRAESGVIATGSYVSKATAAEIVELLDLAAKLKVALEKHTIDTDCLECRTLIGL